MFDLPGFDVSGMSEDELNRKSEELSRKMNLASRWHSTDMVTQLWNMLAVINAERRERMLRDLFEEQKKIFPDVIETEPDLAGKNHRDNVVSEEESKMSQRRKVGRERLAAQRTTNPLNPEPAAPHRRFERSDARPKPPEDTPDDTREGE
jgi:hypothetical protein